MGNTRLFEQAQQLVEEIEDHFPAVPLELVEALEQQYPDQLPAIHDLGGRELSYLVGQVSVVKFLRLQSGRRT